MKIKIKGPTPKKRKYIDVCVSSATNQQVFHLVTEIKTFIYFPFKAINAF